jgi:hypothetical protein
MQHERAPPLFPEHWMRDRAGFMQKLRQLRRGEDCCDRRHSRAARRCTRELDLMCEILPPWLQLSSARRGMKVASMT